MSNVTSNKKNENLKKTSDNLKFLVSNEGKGAMIWTVKRPVMRL